MHFYKNCANQKNWWRLVPRIRRLAPDGTKPPPGGTKPPPSDYCCVKSMKNNIFRESKHHAPLMWRLAANWVSPSGCYSSKNPEISSTPTNLIPTPTILIPLDLRSNRLPSHVYIHYSFIRLLRI